MINFEIKRKTVVGMQRFVKTLSGKKIYLGGRELGYY